VSISETIEAPAPAFSPLVRRYTPGESWALTAGDAHYELISGTLAVSIDNLFAVSNFLAANCLTSRSGVHVLTRIRGACRW
jgi:hypothetical protein